MPYIAAIHAMQDLEYAAFQTSVRKTNAAVIRKWNKLIENVDPDDEAELNACMIRATFLVGFWSSMFENLTGNSEFEEEIPTTRIRAAFSDAFWDSLFGDLAE
jgi:hypothetical protein